MQAAARDYDYVLGRDPLNDCALLNRGSVRQLMGYMTEALVDYENALKLSPASRPGRFNRSLGYAARADLDFLISRSPPNWI